MGMLFSTASSYGQATFLFPNGNPLDGFGVGATISETDPTAGVLVVVTTTAVIGQDGSTEGNTTFSTQSNALGVNSANDLSGLNNQGRDFNPNEAWVFQFNTDVLFDFINFAGWTGQTEVTISSPAFPDMIFNDDGTARGDFDLGSVPVPADTDITIRMTAGLDTEDPAVRLSNFMVTAVPGDPTGTQLIWAGASGDNWNISEQNFTNDGAPSVFATGDNVTIQTPGDIIIAAGDITAGTVNDATADGTVGLQGGTLFADALVKSGAGTLVIADTVDVSEGVTTVGGGVLQVSNSGELDTLALIFSGGGTLQVDSGAGLTSDLNNILGDGGGAINNDEDVTLSSLGNSVIDNPFVKSGAGVLELDLGLGVQSTGPVDLDILEGSVFAFGEGSSAQLNVGSSPTFDGLLTLDGPILMLHNSTVTGTGSILIDFTGTIESRFNFGPVLVSVPVVINDLSIATFDAPAGDSEMTFAGIISGTGTVEKIGNGRIVFAADNTYVGDLFVEAGTLQIGDGVGGSLGDGDVFLVVPDTGNRGTLEFNRNTPVVISQLISGEGDVVVNNAVGGSTELRSDSPYIGTTTIAGGTMVAPVITDGGLPSSIGASSAASENLVIEGTGTLSYTGPAASTDRGFSLGGIVNESVTGGGTISVDGSGPLSFTSTAMVGQDGGGTSPRVLTLSGTAPGTSSIALAIGDGQASTHSLVKSGSTTWELTGANTYTGDTTVDQGRLILSTAFLANQSTVSIASGAVLELSHAEGDTITSLFLDGEQVMAGTYGSSAAVAGIQDAIADDVNFAGTGFLIVTGAGSADFLVWAQSFGVLGAPEDDDDGDGLTNQVEYAFALNPVSGSSVSPITILPDPITGLFTFNRRSTALTGLGYSYSFSTDLEEFLPFAPESEDVVAAGDTEETVTIGIPPAVLANERLFVQVIAE